MIIDFLMGIFIACLAGLGVGGGGLYVLYLVFIKEMGQIESQAINYLFFIVAAIFSLLYHRRKRKIDTKMCVVLGLSGMVGAIFGATFANMIEPEVIRKLFGWFSLVSGSIALGREVKMMKKEKIISKKT